VNILILNSQSNNYHLNNLKKILLKKSNDKITVFKQKITSKFIKKKKIEVIISFHYRYVISNEILKIVKFKAINFHNSYLPKNRGVYPVLWSAVFNNFAICLHFVSKKIDRGDLIFRKKIKISKDKSLFFSYNYIEKNSLLYFSKIWISLRKKLIDNIRIKIIKQVNREGTYNNLFKSKILISSLNIGWKTKIKDVQKNYRLIKKYFK